MPCYADGTWICAISQESGKSDTPGFQDKAGALIVLATHVRRAHANQGRDA